MNYLVCKYHKWCIYPNLNQVTNIGFDYGGTNTSMDPNSPEALAHIRPKFEMGQIVHPSFVGVNYSFEKKMFKQRILNNKPYISSLLSFYKRYYLSKLYHIIKG